MKNKSLLFTGALTTILIVAITGCSDNNADRNNASTANPSQNSTMHSDAARTASSATGTYSSSGDQSSDASNNQMVDPAGGGTGAQ